MRNSMHALLMVAGLLIAAPLTAEEMSACDREAGHPSDPDVVGAGRGSTEVVTHVAIPACRAAVAAEPDNGRYHYQLGRVLFYWANANNGDTSEAMMYLQKAAEMNHTQAVFVMGLISTRMGKGCNAEPFMRQAAEQGLKSARISYVDSALAGTYAGCQSADTETMRGYLEAAADQADGYYEGMLLGALKRQLDD